MQRRSGTRYKEVLREEEAIYIPLLNSLEQLLNKTSILQEVSLLNHYFFFLRRSILKHRNSEPHFSFGPLEMLFGKLKFKVKTLLKND